MARMKTCPSCGQKVGVDRLEVHVKKVHPREKLEFELDEEERKYAREAKEAQRPRARPKGRWIVLAVMVIVVIVVLAFVLEPKGLRIGDTPPGLELGDQYNNPWNLEDHKGLGRCVLLEFFHPQCLYCGQLADETLVPLYSEHSSELEMVSIAITWEHSGWKNPPDYGDIGTFKGSHPGTDWTFLADRGTTAKNLYGVKTGIPMCYLIDKGWKIAYIHEGTIGFSEMEAAIAPFL